MKKMLLTVAGVIIASTSLAYRDTETGTFLTRDPLGYKDGPNLYCYVHCNPITRFDPFGLAWETSNDWSDETKEEFRGKLTDNMAALQNDQKENFDCADAALTGTIRTAEEMNLPLRFKVWNSDKGGWEYMDQADYKSSGEFESAVRTRLGAISIFDNTKQKSDYSKIEKGDMFIFDLRHQPNRSSYSGHTMFIAGRNTGADGTVSYDIIEGHTSNVAGEGTKLDRVQYPEQTIKGAWPNEYTKDTTDTGPGLRDYRGKKESYRMTEPGAREWNWNQFKKAKQSPAP
jgi:hypothetical protein